MRMVDERQLSKCLLSGPPGVPVYFHAQGIGFLSAVNGQDSMRRDMAHILREAKVILVLAPLSLRKCFAFGYDQLAGLPDDCTNGGSNLGVVGDQFGGYVFQC